MDQQSLEVNQPLQTAGAEQLTHAWKLSQSGELTVPSAHYAPAVLADMNLQTPLGYQVGNSFVGLRPRSECEHRFKLEGSLLAQAGDIWNGVELPEVSELHASVYRT